MTKEQLQKKIEQLEAQRETLLMQLGGVNGALSVYNEWLNDAPDAAPVMPVGEVKE